MSISTWLRTPRIRRGLAASAVLLAAGGLILVRAPAGAAVPHPTTVFEAPLGQGNNVTTFAGPGAHGQVALSHTKVLAGAPTQVFAEVRMIADKPAGAEHERAPLAMAIVLDTSGSMEGDKIEQAKDAVVRMVREMRDEDEVAFIRYDTEATVVQPLTRVAYVREGLVQQVRAIRAGGGTAIPRGLGAALAQIDNASRGRVKRIVLASDGLDSTRADAERLAQTGFEHGVTISTMGIGTDFDESYMGGLARAGHGNFAFVKDASALAGFLGRELVETATTTVENATVRLAIPPGMRFVRAIGADASPSFGGVELRVGSLFAGDERRVVVELQTTLGAGETGGLSGMASWSRVSGETESAAIAQLALLGTANAAEVAAGRDAAVLASATSANASALQLEAAEAYQRGDSTRAQALIDQSVSALDSVVAAAPAPVAASLTRQAGEYKARKSAYAGPPSAAGNVRAKEAFDSDSKNLGRKAW